MKRIFALTAFLCSLLCQSFGSMEHVYTGNAFNIKTIVIDAGHGGHDSGCLGSFAKEKNVTLAVALKVGALIEKNYPNIKVIYTRKTDEFIELYERADIANRNNADLFISIHCNANDNKGAYGTESWVMGLHKSEANLATAQRENSVILLEDNYAQKYNGFDPNSPESYIMFSLNQNAHLTQSLDVAAKVEQEFTKDGRSSRGVKQAGYLVLWRTTMPSLLIETGFLTNLTEEKYLTSESGQVEIAHSVFKAVEHYKNEVEGKNEAEPETLVAQNTTTKKSYPNVTKFAKPAPDSTNNKPDVADTEVKVSLIKTPPKTKAGPVAASQVIYKVQITASNKTISKKDPIFKGLKDISNDKSPKGAYRYMVGNYTTLADAQERMKQMKTHGFKDAFVVTYKDGERVK